MRVCKYTQNMTRMIVHRITVFSFEQCRVFLSRTLFHFYFFFTFLYPYKANIVASRGELASTKLPQYLSLSPAIGIETQNSINSSL